ncbi:VOC family protein [Actinopolymorpha sp. NPDC004070]|uniref:VOC family protein n=1 Tax=Actinopolymorpha sp. NPDC004070 TaxID=3154548 RepID=UPI0033AD0187
MDCIDPRRVARFWSELLGREEGSSEPGWVYLGGRDDLLPRLVFQPVSEPKVGKTRIHLDIVVDDIAVGIEEVISLGGSFTRERHDYDEGVAVVLTGPDGNEFCLCQYYSSQSA